MESTEGEDGGTTESRLQRVRADAERRFGLYLADVQAGLAADAGPDETGADPATREELRRIVADYRRLRQDYQELAGSLAAGRRLGKFLLVREIGRGGSGVVWEAEQALPRRRVALKILHPQLARDEHALRRFEREALAATRTVHERIVAVHEVGEHEGLRWIAMELVPGGLALADHVADLRRRGSAPPDHARRMARLFVDVARALHAAHAAGVVHRDVKPGNILLAPDGSPRLADFGLAALSGSGGESAAGQRVGTPCYMSPEQVRGDTALDARSDIYSLGVALYEALTFERPHAGGDEHELQRRIVQDELPDPRKSRPGIPRDLARIVQRMAANRPAARYSDAAAAADDLERFLRGEGVQAGAPSRLWRAWTLVRRYPAWSSAAAGCVAGLALFFVLSVRAASEERRAAAAAELVQAVIRLDDPAASVGGPGELAGLALLLREAAALADGEDGPRAARLHLAAARCERFAGRLAVAAGSLQEALVQLPPDEEPELRLQVLDALAGTFSELDDFAGLQRVLPEALALSKKLDKPAAGGAGPHQRTWRLLCALWNGHLRREDRAAARLLEQANPELSRGDLLRELRARYQRLLQQEDAAEADRVEAGLQILRALCSLERYSEGLQLAEAIGARNLRVAGGADRQLDEAVLLRIVCVNRLRMEDPATQRRRAEQLAREFEAAWGPQHPLALVARLRWCVSCIDDTNIGKEPGGWPAVRERYAQLVDDMRKCLGPVHLDTLKARTGRLLSEINGYYAQPDAARLRSMLPEADDLVASMRQTYGGYHSRTVIAERVRIGLQETLGDAPEALAARRRFVDHMAASEGQLALDAFDLQSELLERLLWLGEHDEVRRRAADFKRMLQRVEGSGPPRAEMELRCMQYLAAEALLDDRTDEARTALDEWDRHEAAARQFRSARGHADVERSLVLGRRTLEAALHGDALECVALVEAWQPEWTARPPDESLFPLLLAHRALRLQDARFDAALAALRADSIAGHPEWQERWARIDRLAAGRR